MKKTYCIFLILQISAFSISGAIADEKTDHQSTTGKPENVSIDNLSKGRKIILIEEAMETKSLQISLNERTGAGIIVGKICDQCDEIQVQITHETRAYHGGVEVPLASAKARLGRDATVFFDMKTKQVTRIKW
jgi:hypothetical protein